MVIWKGWGILGLIIPFLVLVLINSMELNDSIASWINFVGLILSGIAVWSIGKRLNSRKDEVFTSEKTGAQFKLGNQHTLFFIPLQYWAIVYLFTGAITLFK